MPYITQERRKEIEEVGESIGSPGELNYMITSIIWGYYKDSKNYQSINDVLGALEGAKLEFYRRVAAPYEDIKIKENGDVFN